MEQQALGVFVDQVLADGEQKFGPDADPVWLEQYAREAVLDLWLEQPECRCGWRTWRSAGCAT